MVCCTSGGKPLIDPHWEESPVAPSGAPIPFAVDARHGPVKPSSGPLIRHLPYLGRLSPGGRTRPL